ncbi:hypothetical protein [Weissella viridescens]|uniref:hypothetical protein n=1 Tax=Weissella viridescens TaxID=1629 RepID=UPI003AF28AE9
MNSKKYIIFSKEIVAPVSVLNNLPANPEPYLVVPYTAEWHYDTKLVILLTKLGARDGEEPMEVLKDRQLGQAIPNRKSGVSPQESSEVTGFEQYANEALDCFMRDLTEGTRETDAVQPHENFKYNNVLYQWAVVPV